MYFWFIRFPQPLEHLCPLFDPLTPDSVDIVRLTCLAIRIASDLPPATLAVITRFTGRGGTGPRTPSSQELPGTTVFSLPDRSTRAGWVEIRKSSGHPQRSHSDLPESALALLITAGLGRLDVPNRRRGPVGPVVIDWVRLF